MVNREKVIKGLECCTNPDMSRLNAISPGNWSKARYTRELFNVPSVPAVPLEPLAKWITENLSPRFGCDVCAKETENYERECCNCPMMNEQEVRDALTKWMEEQDAAD